MFWYPRIYRFDFYLQTKNVDLCLIEHKMVNCSMDCRENVTQIGFIHLENTPNDTNSIDLSLCMDSMLRSSAFRINDTCKSIHCIPIENENQSLGSCFYVTWTFWIYVILMCIGTIGFNVSNCVSDATCFDMLGDKTMDYGAQRVWGTIGFGLTALVAGVIIHIFELDSSRAVVAIAPALIIMTVFGALDIVSIKWLKLPRFTNESDTIAGKVMELLMQKQILIFLCFATLAGILDSFIIYYMFWYLEEIAQQTGFMDRIKLIEGCVVAAECLGGEILFFLISGKILKRIGYVHCLSFCFFMYFIRLGLISLIPNPWWLVLIELFMQGCTYALTYTCIVGYASEVAPPGTTATVQGLVAGMDDGAGFAIGSLIGGQMYKRLGGTQSFRIFSIAALITCFAHILLRPAKNCEHHLKHSERNHDIENDTAKKPKHPETNDESNVELLQKQKESIVIKAPQQ